MAVRRMFVSREEFEAYCAKHDKETEEMKVRHDQAVAELKRERDRLADELDQKHGRDMEDARKQMMALCAEKRLQCAPMLNSIEEIKRSIGKLSDVVTTNSNVVAQLVGYLKREREFNTQSSGEGVGL